MWSLAVGWVPRTDAALRAADATAQFAGAQKRYCVTGVQPLTQLLASSVYYSAFTL